MQDPCTRLQARRLRLARFPGNEGRPQITGVLPAGKLGPTVSAEQGVKLDATNVAGVSTKQLNKVGEAGGIKPKQ